MTKRMLIDATHSEETRVAIVNSYRDNNRLEDLDFDLTSKPILRGNIYLAKVMRIEPSLQAAFVEYGGNRHGFLPFSEIHPDYFRIPMADRPEDEIPEDEVDDKACTPEKDQEDLSSEEVSTEEATEEDIKDASSVDSLFQEESPFGADEEIDDLGLITDFGNAAIPMGASIDRESIAETVGAEDPLEEANDIIPEKIRKPQRPRYRIQEVLKRGQVMLIQVVKEERGNKGAALTSFLSLAGRYCVLMPNTDHGGGVSRKITNHQDRRRLKDILDQLKVPEGMAVILRTAGMEQEINEIQRDLEYLLRLWDNIREQTLQSTAPTLIYEEANLIKRSVRDLYSNDIDEVLISGQQGYDRAKDFMSTLMPDHLNKVKLYTDDIPLFFRYHVEHQIDTLHTPVVQLKSGGYLVINPTEALVAIDVNSGRATRERHIEETALKTNLEAADEVARQLRLRDLAGLVVIDFIDMEDNRNNVAVERRIKEAMKNDRARLQIGRITHFGLMELSRQRLRPSLVEINFEKCPHCEGTGTIRSINSAALSILRVIEEEGIKQSSSEIVLYVATKVALYILNQKRENLSRLEKQYDLHVLLHSDDDLIPSDFRIERIKNTKTNKKEGPAVNTAKVFAKAERDLDAKSEKVETDTVSETPKAEETEAAKSEKPPRRRTRSRSRSRQSTAPKEEAQENKTEKVATETTEQQKQPEDGEEKTRRRRRGRRGGRRRNNAQDGQSTPSEDGSAEQKTPRNNPRNSPKIPTSVHEIDTTPKPISAERTSGTASYEVINPPSDHPKGGWWRRLTGQ